ncbi:MAG TPA: hypothetical protein VFE31_08645 [Opitutaceae bacterium]|jgi:hypothetical protein|nr:hypothetical protein [Opitutaceae bacterium]
MRTVLVIDPGPTRSAAVIWDGEKIHDHHITENAAIRAWLAAQMHMDPPALVALEMVQSFGMPVGRDVFETVLQVGRLQELCEGRTQCRLIYRGQVKIHVCHSARARDSNIRAALIDRFGVPGTKKAPGLTHGLRADEWQAFALAVPARDTRQTLGAASLAGPSS